MFCGLHVLEVKGIADGDVAQGIKGPDPVTSNQLTRDEIEAAEKDPSRPAWYIAEPKVVMPETAVSKRGPRYTPVSRRHDRPNAVLWLLRNHPEFEDEPDHAPCRHQADHRPDQGSHALEPGAHHAAGSRYGLACSQTDLDMNKEGEQAVAY